MKHIARVIILLLLLLAVGCGSDNKPSGSSNDMPIIRVGVLNGPTAMSLTPLLELRPSSVITGYHTEFIIKNSPLTLRPQLLREQLEIAVIPASLAVLLYNRGLPYRAAALTVQGSLTLTGSDTSVTSWNDLKHKTVHLMGRGATPDALFRILLQKKGLLPGRDLNISYTFPDPMDLAQAAAAGQVSLAILSEPMNSLALSKNPKLRVIMDLTGEWRETFGPGVPLAQSLLVFHDSFLKKHPAAARRFMEIYRNALNQVIANPLQAGQIMKGMGLAPSAEIIANAIPNCHFSFVPIKNIKQGLNRFLDILFTFDPTIIGGKPPDENFCCAPQ